MISTNFLECYGIVGAVPKGWNKLVSEYGKLHDIKNDIVDSLKSDKRLCKYFNKYSANHLFAPLVPGFIYFVT
jgi:hypothetical protein